MKFLRVIVRACKVLVLLLGLPFWMLNEWLISFTRHGRANFYPKDEFAWPAELEANWHVIRGELDALLENLEDIPAIQEVSTEQLPLSQDDKWRSFILNVTGTPLERNCQQCPQTARLLARIPDLIFAQFSILAPGKHIEAHRGPYKGILNCHLGLLVPNKREDCRIRVRDETVFWEEGKLFIFDDTRNHEVWNDTDSIRVVLIIHVVRPLPFPLSTVNRWIRNISARSASMRSLHDNLKIWFQHLDEKQRSD